MKNSGSIEDLKRAQSKRAITRDIEYLRPLLVMFNLEKEVSLNDIKKIVSKGKADGRCLLINSDVKLAAHFCVEMLMQYYDKNTTYKYQNISFLVDAWFADFNTKMKKELIYSDILILDYFRMVIPKGPSLRVLKELISARKNLNLKTWIFIEKDVDIELKDELHNFIDSEINIEINK